MGMKITNFLFSTTPESSTANEITMTALRVFAGATMAIAHGFGKIPPSDQLIGGVEGFGFPMPVLFAWAAALSEFLGGVFLAAGFMTRLGAFFMAVTMAVAGFGIHANDPFQRKELALFYLFVAIVFVARGAGRLSVDRIFSKR